MLDRPRETSVCGCQTPLALKSATNTVTPIGTSMSFTTGSLTTSLYTRLRKYARNPIRKDLTPTSTLLAQVEIMVDKMHMAGHIDDWCKQNCDSRKCKELEKVRSF